MPTQQKGGTVIEGLTKVFPEIAGLKVLPDAAPHLKFLMSLEQGIMSYIQQDAQRQQQQMAMAAQQATSMGMGGAPGGPGGMMGGAAPGGGMGGQPGGAPMAPPGMQPGGGPGMSGMGPQAAAGADELRRALAGPSAPVGG
jgi:hypothetical protein